MVPRKYMGEGGYNKTEGKVSFTNGSWIRVMGADNPDHLRGLSCHLLLVDEVKDLKSDVIDTILKAWLVDYDSPMVLAGTPPEVAEHPFWTRVNEAQTSPDWRFYHGTSYDNPHLKREVLDRERAGYEKRGDIDIFMREFMAQYVPGGKRAVFPMLTQEHIYPYGTLLNKIRRHGDQWLYYATMDPGTASCFAVTLHAVNPYKGYDYVMDEVYEQQQSETSVGKMWRK